MDPSGVLQAGRENAAFARHTCTSLWIPTNGTTWEGTSLDETGAESLEDSIERQGHSVIQLVYEWEEEKRYWFSTHIQVCSIDQRHKSG